MYVFGTRYSEMTRDNNEKVVSEYFCISIFIGACGLDELEGRIVFWLCVEEIIMQYIDSKPIRHFTGRVKLEMTDRVKMSGPASSWNINRRATPSVI